MSAICPPTRLITTASAIRQRWYVVILCFMRKLRHRIRMAVPSPSFPYASWFLEQAGRADQAERVHSARSVPKTCRKIWSHPLCRILPRYGADDRNHRRRQRFALCRCLPPPSLRVPKIHGTTSGSKKQATARGSLITQPMRCSHCQWKSK